MKCAVIGVGYLGKFHAQKYAQLPNIDLVAVCDINKTTCDEVAAQHQTRAIYDYRELLGKVDAVSIVVPTVMHHQIAKEFITCGAHVLLEKPIANTLGEADDLINTAKQHGVILQVGHLERFNPVVLALDNVLDKPLFIECVRQAPFKPRVKDVNVILDLMIHDIDLINRLVNQPLRQLHASGTSVLTDRIDSANARLEYQNGCVANVVASRVSFELERKFRIFQENSFITLDLQHKKIGIHRKGDTKSDIPEIITEEQVFDQGDALMEQTKAFIDSIEKRIAPVVSGEDGRQALAIAIEITQMVREQMNTHAQATFQETERVN